MVSIKKDERIGKAPLTRPHKFTLLGAHTHVIKTMSLHRPSVLTLSSSLQPMPIVASVLPPTSLTMCSHGLHALHYELPLSWVPFV